MKKEFWGSIVRFKKNGEKVNFYIHKKCDERDLSIILGVGGMPCQEDDVYDDDLAHVLATTNTCVAYRVKNDVYIIPATIKAVVNNSDNKMHLWFDYPVEMDRKDLVKY